LSPAPHAVISAVQHAAHHRDDIDRHEVSVAKRQSHFASSKPLAPRLPAVTYGRAPRARRVAAQHLLRFRNSVAPPPAERGSRSRDPGPTRERRAMFRRARPRDDRARPREDAVTRRAAPRRCHYNDAEAP